MNSELPDTTATPLSFISRTALAGAIAVVAVFALALFFFAMPVWDDLIRAIRPVEMGWWKYVFEHVYFHWQGRWASCGLESAVLPRLDIAHYYFLLIGGVAVVNTAAIYVVCRWLISGASQARAVMVAAALLALLWAGMPSLGETVYWFTGAVENALVYALAALVLVALCRLDRSSLAPPLRAVLAGLLAISAICVCGFHELYGGIFCVALGLGTLDVFFDSKRDSTSRSSWTVVTIAAAAGLLIVVLAPGNNTRLVSDGSLHSRHLIYDLHVAFHEGLHFVPRWLFDPKVLAASVWIAVNPLLRVQRPDATSRFPWRWALPAAWLLVLAVGFFLPSWAFGKDMPPRTLSGVYIIFVLGWFAVVYLWSPRILPRLTPQTQVIGSCAVLVLAISLVLFGNVRLALHDFHSRIFPWHRAVEKRFAMLSRLQGTDAVVPLLPKPPFILLNGEITNDAGDYRNWSTSMFFHLRSLRYQPISGPLPPPPVKPTVAP
jgi:hypothetical protein